MASLRPVLRAVRTRGRATAARSFRPLALATELTRAVRIRRQIATFRHRAELARRFPGPHAPSPRPVVVAVVTHLAVAERDESEALERLTRTLDSLVESLGHTELELVVNTMPDRHLTPRLPSHLAARVTVSEHEDVEPMLLGFEAQEELVRRAGDADWFLYLEDDILLGDALLLEKLTYFNENAPSEALLLPHRYELWRGRRTYIDLVSKASPDIGSWNRLTELEIGGWRFAEFENPHSGFYALSREQLRRWLDTGRHWHGKISWVAARESAATGALAEAFRLYKPHPQNMTYLEVRHLDTKYSEQHAVRHGLGTVDAP